MARTLECNSTSANERQRRAKEFYYEEVQKAIKEIDSSKKHNINMERSRVEVSEILNNTYSNLDKYEAYQGLLNPGEPVSFRVVLRFKWG